MFVLYNNRISDSSLQKVYEEVHNSGDWTGKYYAVIWISQQLATTVVPPILANATTVKGPGIKYKTTRSEIS